VAERQLRNMARIVDDLLDVSRITRGKIELRKERLELGSLVRRSVESLQAQIEGRQHQLICSIPDEPIYICADMTRVDQVLVNLLTNAAKYTDPGGTLWLTLERSGQEAVIRVRDTGVGIPEKLLPRLFDLFVQSEQSLDRAQGGLGIGLTLVKKLTEMHGGSITAASSGPGLGSEFTVRLPL
jgi:signal transduction histidine kinase